MDRVSSNSSSNQSFQANSCNLPEAPPAQATASCPDGSVAYEDGVCAKYGLKGSATAAQRYVANLASNPGAEPSATGTNAAPSAPGAPTQREHALRQLVNDAGAAVVDLAKEAFANGSFEAGKSVDYEVKLPNGCKAKFGVSVAMGVNGEGKPELTMKVSGTIEGQVGLVGAQADFSYSQSASGEESLSIGACLFGGAHQEAGGLVDLEAKAGLCATIEDTSQGSAVFHLDAVAKAEAQFGLGGAFGWGHEFEARTTLARETLSYDIVH